MEWVAVGISVVAVLLAGYIAWKAASLPTVTQMLGLKRAIMKLEAEWTEQLATLNKVAGRASKERALIEKAAPKVSETGNPEAVEAPLTRGRLMREARRRRRGGV